MISADTVGQELARTTRTLVLGGTAVIMHGLTRTTKNVDFWIDPHPTPDSWAAPIEAILCAHHELAVVYLDDMIGGWEPAQPGTLDQIPARGRMLRLLGADRPIDIFYQPNEVELSEFDAFWNRAIPLNDGTRLLEIIDLIITKQFTERPHDQTDINFLQAKIEKEMCDELRRQPYAYAESKFSRFRSAQTAFSATTNPDPKVRELGLNILHELAREGDPFAQEHLDDISKKI